MNKSDLLILHYEDLSSRVNKLFEDLRESRTERELFIQNPSLVIADKLLQRRVPSQNLLDQTNRILYSWLSNPKLQAWSVKYQIELQQQLSRFRTSQDPIEAKKSMLQAFDQRKLLRDLAS